MVYVDLKTKHVTAVKPTPVFKTLLRVGNRHRTGRAYEAGAPRRGNQGHWWRWWRRGRVELPVQKQVARTYYKFSQRFLSRLAKPGWQGHG